ncbi:MAG TPA: BON domain-containing protein [Candidatus Acidoferrales bacterium]|nr:BON domain-containing protein [Candidatus Acidoferrales bacterium]
MRRTSIGLLISLAAFAVLTIGCAKKADDAQLATNIKAQMFSDPQTKDSGLQVAVKEGVVTLSGTVPSDAARYEAYKLASTTPGVTKVSDQTVVQAAAPPTQTAEATPPVTTPEETPAPTPAPAANSGSSNSRRARERRERAERVREENARRQHEAEAREEQVARRERDERQTAADSRQSVQRPPQDAPPLTAPVRAAEVPPPPPPPQPLTATFPAGTTVEIQTVDPVDTGTNHVGDEFQTTLAQPLTSAGVVVVPAGTNIYMRLTEAQSSGQYKGRSELQLQLVRLEFNGHEYPVTSDPYMEAGKSRGKNTAAKVGGGAALGAIIGAIAGGGKGAAIGAGVGGAGGGVVQGVSKVKPLRIPSETRLDFRLSQPLNVTYMPHHHHEAH